MNFQVVFKVFLGMLGLLGCTLVIIFSISSLRTGFKMLVRSRSLPPLRATSA
jgi:hypothetical protein